MAGGSVTGSNDVTAGLVNYLPLNTLPTVAYFEQQMSNIAANPLALPNVPVTRGKGQVTDLATLNTINKTAQNTLNEVTAEINERLSGQLTKGSLDNVSDEALRGYLDTHLAYINEVLPDYAAQDQAAASKLTQQFGDIELLKSGIDQMGANKGKAFTQQDYNVLGQNFVQAQEALVKVSQEINDRLTGKDNFKELNQLGNDQLYNFLGYYQKEYLNKQTGEWQRAINRGIGDAKVNQQVLDGLVRQNGEIQLARLAISESGVIGTDPSINYLNQYNRNLSPYGLSSSVYNGPTGTGQLGYVSSNYANSNHYGLGFGAGAYSPPTATMNNTQSYYGQPQVYYARL
jgi:hypothetical protein